MIPVNCKSCGAAVEVAGLLDAAHDPCPSCGGYLFGAPVIVTDPVNFTRAQNRVLQRRRQRHPRWVSGKYEWLGTILGALAGGAAMMVLAFFADIEFSPVLLVFGGAAVGILLAESGDFLLGKYHGENYLGMFSEYQRECLDVTFASIGAMIGWFLDLHIIGDEAAYYIYGAGCGMFVGAIFGKIFGEMIGDTVDWWRGRGLDVDIIMGESTTFQQ